MICCGESQLCRSPGGARSSVIEIRISDGSEPRTSGSSMLPQKYGREMKTMNFRFNKKKKDGSAYEKKDYDIKEKKNKLLKKKEEKKLIVIKEILSELIDILRPLSINGLDRAAGAKLSKPSCSRYGRQKYIEPGNWPDQEVKPQYYLYEEV